MSQNTKTLLPNTKFYNFSRKFWQVTAYLGTFFVGATGGPRNFTFEGPRLPLPPPSWNRPCRTVCDGCVDVAVTAEQRRQ